MKWLFAHDNCFYKKESGEVYSEVAFQYKSFERYLEHADELVVVARLEMVPVNTDINQWNLSSGPQVQFVEAPDPYGFRCFTPFPKGYHSMEKEVAKVDAVIARLPSEIGYMAVDAARKLGKPYVVEVVGDAYGAMKEYGNLKGKIYAPVAKHKMKKRVQQAPFALYITDNVLQRLYPTSGKEVSCSNVELSIVTYYNRVNRLARIADDSRKIRIGMNGSLSSAYKGFDTAIKAVALAKKELPPFEFEILGKGSPLEWEELARQLGVEEDIHFIGSMPNANVHHWLDEIDLFLMPSRTEGQGRALIEALSRGCPSLGSNVGGIPELLLPEQLHEPEDSELLAQKMIRVLKQPELQLRYAKEAFLSTEKFEAEVLEEKRRRFFHQLKLAAERK